MMPDGNWLTQTILLIPPLLLSLSIHEFAHARTALAFGDPTAKLLGRVSLNPLVHLDFWGTLILVVTQFIGWAKPVPVNRDNLHPPRLGDVAVALAGPLSNLGLAILCGLLLRALLHFEIMPDSAIYESAVLMLSITVVANLCLFAFNMLPLFPLDGHHILRQMLPQHRQMAYMYWQVRYGSAFLAALIFLPRIVETITHRQVISPTDWIYRFVCNVAFNLMGL